MDSYATAEFRTVIYPMCGSSHVLCEDGGDDTAAVVSAD
jgi:hypothetical protein